jgi:hypothetical protein
VLESVDASLEAMLRATVPLSASEIDVSFEPPTRDWSAKLTRPTVSAYLWDIKRSRDRARTGTETIVRNGEARQRLVLPRVELRYVVSVWASEHRDERALLGGVLRSLLSFDSVPETFVAAPLRDLSPLHVRIPREGDQQVDALKMLDGQVKPVLDLVIVSDVDTGDGRVLAAPATSFEFGLRDIRTPGRQSASRRVAGEVLDPDAVGKRVHGPSGSAVVNAAGRFLIAASVGDEIVVDTVPPRTALVPEHGGVVIA